MSSPSPSLFPSAAEQLYPLHVALGHASYARYENISIGVWVGQATLPVVQMVQEVTKFMIARFPRGHSSVSFVLDGLPAPTPEAQALIGKQFEARSQLSVTGIVLEGSGFWASGLRGMINNSHREANGPTSLKIVTSIDQLVGWFAEAHEARTQVSIAPMILRDLLQHARKVGERAARGEAEP